MTNTISKVIRNGTEYEFSANNGGVTSVNTQTGAVTVNDIKVAATAPSSPTEGMTWYDTTNDQLKVYDGTNWNVTGKEYNAGEGIEIGTVQDYSAMQGPAPSGFHIPTKDENVALIAAMTTLGIDTTNGNCMKTYLKMPFAGDRFSSSADVHDQGSYGHYWSTDAYNANFIYSLSFDTSTLTTQNGHMRSEGFSLRCFKDTSVIPDSNWTTLYAGTGDAGIFYNTTDGLISISSDGTNWITIQDKNLGATTVYNDGDILAESNCGYYYQRGNNYGFAWTGSVTTSSTKVDASNYGPGNYYNSSTFITVSSSPFDRSSVQNDNLWGGETGVVTLSNAITNTGVLSVNGQTGNVTVASGIQNDTTGTTSTMSSIRVGTEAEYALITPVAGVEYHIY